MYSYHPNGKILEVETASHTRIAIAEDLPMPAALASVGNLRTGYRWFEEDAGFAAAILAFPEHFAPARVASAKDTLRDWLPDAYMAHFEESLTAAESKLLGQREWDKATRSNFVVLAGFGDEHWNVPNGHVYACGFRQVDEATAGFLVPQDKYVCSGRLVLDDFPRWEPDRNLPLTKTMHSPTATSPAAA